MNLSHATCNSKNEDKFFSCYLYLKFFFLYFWWYTIGHSPIIICQLTSTNTYVYIYIYIYIYACMRVCVYVCGFFSKCILFCIYLKYNLVIITYFIIS